MLFEEYEGAVIHWFVFIFDLQTYKIYILAIAKTILYGLVIIISILYYIIPII